MGDAYVVAEADVEGVRLDGDTALVRTTIGQEQGSERLEQRVVWLAPGRAQPRRDDDRDVVLYVVAGRGTLEVDGEPHQLEPGTGAYVAAGETRQVDNPGPEELVIVAVLAPASPPGTDGGRRRGTVRFDDQPELRADSKRTFRYLVNQDACCRAVTQFVGLIETCRAPDHSHAHGRHIDAYRPGLVLPPAAGHGALHRELRRRDDGHPRRVPSGGRSGVALVRRRGDAS